MKILSILLWILLVSTSAIAAPFLVSDPVDPATCGGTDQPTCPVKATIYYQKATSYNPIVWGPQTLLEKDWPLEADMSLNYDLIDLSPGVYKFTSVATDGSGGKSVLSNPTMLGPKPLEGTKTIP